MALTQAEFEELYSQEDIGTITRQSCGLGLIAEFDDAPDGPVQTCARASGLPVGEVTPVTGVGGVIAAPGPSTGTGSSTGGGTGTRSRALAATGASTALAIGGVLLLGVAACARRRGARAED